MAIYARHPVFFFMCRSADAIVRPLSKGIRHEQVNDSTIRFRIPRVDDNRGYAGIVGIDQCQKLWLITPNKVLCSPIPSLLA